jgi:hypothetical protein
VNHSGELPTIHRPPSVGPTGLSFQGISPKRKIYQPDEQPVGKVQLLEAYFSFAEKPPPSKGNTQKAEVIYATSMEVYFYDESKTNQNLQI